MRGARADYVTRYAKKEDAMPKHSMGDADSDGSDDGSDADEKGFLSSSEDEEDPAAGHLDRCGARGTAVWMAGAWSYAQKPSNQEANLDGAPQHVRPSSHQAVSAAG